MKKRSKWLLALALAAIAGAALLLWPRGPQDAQAKQARLQLRADGFKTDYTDFNWWVSPEMAARGRAVAGAEIGLGTTLVADPKSLILRPAIAPTMTGRYSASVVWRHQKLGRPGKDPWAAMQADLDANRERLDAACEAVLAGPYGFRVELEDPNVRHLSQLPEAARALSVRTLIELHNGRRSQAWTNVMAITRVVTVWQTESLANSHRVRFSLARMAYSAIWHALQDHHWSEEQLAALEKEWANVNFFEAMPDLVAYDRTQISAHLQSYPERPPLQADFTWREGFKEPKYVRQFLKARADDQRYRVQGVYEDRSDALYYYKDRELEIRRAIKADSIKAMLGLPGMTNPPRFVSKHSASQVPSSIDYSRYCLQSESASGMLGFAAEAEIRRRLILTAIALERHRMRTGAYPERIPESVPLDFADGQPLRYRTTADGRFWMYSAGLDCVDNGGVTATANEARTLRPGLQKGTDLLWPLPEPIIEE